MFDLSPAALGLFLFLLGLVFILLTLSILRLIPRLFTASSSDPITLSTPTLVEPHEEAVIVVQTGGRVIYINHAARELFNYWEPDANLENLARRTHPSETFLSLCAGPSQTRFTLNSRMVEGSSYFLPGSLAGGSGLSACLVSLRRPGLVLKEVGVDDPASLSVAAVPSTAVHNTSQTFNFFTELTRAMASSLDLEVTLKTILESVERLFPSDLMEISIWDAESQTLTPYRLVGLPGIDRRLEKVVDGRQVNSAYSGYLVANQEALLAMDAAQARPGQPGEDGQRYPYQSYLGAPLLIAGRLVGTLEMASLARDVYTENDLEVVQLLSGQAAVAVNNALLYLKELHRSVELAGLANLAQSVSVLRDPQDLYARLVESISPLLDVEILGFLIYDENHQALEGQEPFLGLQPSVLEWCRVVIEPGSPAENLWQGCDPIVVENAPGDARIQAFGLHHLALAAGIRHTVLMPLSSSGRTLGYLQAANKRDGSPFDSNDLRILAIVAGQAAPIIDNAALMLQSRRRAQRAETLRRIASLTSSAATLEEILKFSVLDLARLLQADVAALFLLDDARDELRLHRPSAFGISPEIGARLARLAVDDPRFAQSATGSRQPFFQEDLADPETAIPDFYRLLIEEAQICSAISAPLAVRERAIGELFIGRQKPGFYSSADLQTVSTAAWQLAAAIERAELYSQTDQNLRQRVDQLVALTRVSRELNTTLNLEDLLQRVYTEALSATRSDCGSILLFDLDGGETAPGSPRVRFHAGDPAGAELHPLERLVLEQAETVVVASFSPDEHALDAGAFHPSHPGVLSALATPIAYQGRVAGLIHLHSAAADHFGAAEREIAEALAVQAAIALGNAQRYEEQQRRGGELNRRVETLSRIFEVTQIIQTEQPLAHSLDAIAYAIQSATAFEIVLISLYDPDGDQYVRQVGVGIPLEELAELKDHPAPRASIEMLLKPQFRLSNSYFIPAEQSDPLPDDLTSYASPLLDLLGGEGEAPTNAQEWDSDDMLLLPLYGVGGEPLGLISVDAPRDNTRPDRAVIETLEIFGSQAALVIETQLKVHGLRAQVESLGAELEFARETAEKARQHLPVLLHKDLEQTISAQALAQRARRIRAGLDITELISQQKDPEEVLLTLGREILARMDFDLLLIAEGSGDSLNLTHTLGHLPADANPKALLGQRNPLRHALQTGEILLISNLADSEEWQTSPLLRALDARACLCFPILAWGEANNGKPGGAALMAVNCAAAMPFGAEDNRLFDLIIRQVAIALHNLHLQEETSRRLKEVTLLLDFTRQLGSLDPNSILTTLVESAQRLVPTAQMAMAALWDPRQETLTPQAMAGYANENDLRQIRYRSGEGVPGLVFARRSALNLEVVDFARHYNLSQENLLRYRNAVGGRLPVSCLAAPIMAGAAEPESPGNAMDSQIHRARALPLGVLVLDNSQTTAAFTQSDLAVIAALVQQTALTLENARLYQSARQRSSQLQALTAAAATITSSLQSQELIDSLLVRLRAILSYDTGTLWLRRKDSRAAEQVSVRAAAGFADSEQRLGLTVDIQDSALIREMVAGGKPIWVPDVRQDPRFQSLASVLEDAAPGDPPAPVFEYFSWLGVPLIASGQVIGVIALEKAEANYYTSDDIQLAATFAGQAAVALENAELYEESVQRALELNERTQTLSILNRLSAELSGSLDVARILDFAVQEFMQIMNCTSASALLIERQGAGPQGRRLILQAEFPYSSDASPYYPGVALPETPLIERLQESLGIFHTDNAAGEVDLLPLSAFLASHGTRALLVAPLITGNPDNPESGERRLEGVLMAHHEQPHGFSPEMVELARTISNQVSIALQNARSMEETISLTEDLEMRVAQRTAELGRERQRAETLLRIITELSASLDLEQVLNRTLVVLSEYVDAAQITVMIARPGERKLQRLASIGYTPEPPVHGSPTPFSVDEGLGGWIISQRQSVLVSDVLTDGRWVRVDYSDNAWKPTFQHRSALGVPLMSGAEALGCLLLFHPDVDHFSLGQLDLVQAAANQVAVAVNNAELYRLIRDQAEDLGTMLRSQQIETSRSKAILEAVADGVLVTDQNRNITLFNESAVKILGLERAAVLGKSMEHFAGLFGRATRRWMETVEAWSKEPGANKPGETFAEQFTLEDGRVIFVRLAPVSMRNDFLGTVSIFQDITHQVEVDRLKSEFVATVSHELRTPMTSIKGYVDILLMGAAGSLSEQQTQFLQVVKNNAERLAVLVNDLLDVSQIEAGRLRLTLYPVNLDELVDQAIGDLQRRSAGDTQHITVEKESQPGLPRVLADGERIRRVLDNLLGNAYQYNLPNGKILVRLHTQGQEVQVDVQDTGVGIHPNDHERVFERFFRGENPLTLGVAGTGLGLPIVKSLVEMHNGRIWLESPGTAGQGSTFSFTLPVYTPQ